MKNFSIKKGRFPIAIERNDRKRCPKCGSLSIIKRTREYFEKTRYRFQKCNLNFDVPVLCSSKSSAL